MVGEGFEGLAADTMFLSSLLGDSCAGPRESGAARKPLARPRQQVGAKLPTPGDADVSGFEPTYPPPGGLSPEDRERKEVLAAAARRVATPLANQHIVVHVARFGQGVKPLRVSVAECGDPGGSPVLVMYGVGASRYFCLLFDDLAKELGLRLIAPDRPG